MFYSLEQNEKKQKNKTKNNFWAKESHLTC